MAWHDLQALGIIDGAFPHNNFKDNFSTRKVSTDYTALCRVAGFSENSELSDILNDFPDVLSDSLDANRFMKGPPLHIYMRENHGIKPWKSLTARLVPMHLKDAAEEAIKQALAAGVIAPVTEPTEWISPGFFVEKPGGSGVRLVTDFTALNKAIERQVHPFPSTLEMMRNISPSSKIFCKLDAVQGYFQIPLDEESSHLTTFLLPSGRYRYLRCPMGLSASSGAWCERSDKAIEGLAGVTKLVDDILIQAPNLDVLRERITSVLLRCRENGITLSKRKFFYGPEVEFAGFLVSASGVRPHPDKLKAIKDCPPPKDLTELRSFLGMANQLGHFIPDLSHATVSHEKITQEKYCFPMATRNAN
ncbi:MAG: RNA-directed DNA polymerase [Candidatus Competibacteraceae bacterium]|nr:RNA-directed DNA polymerase [Candidatus Competibacteraceae bacterium]